MRHGFFAQKMFSGFENLEPVLQVQSGWRRDDDGLHSIVTQHSLRRCEVLAVVLGCLGLAALFIARANAG
jgi:hypothetical protein